MCQRGCIPVSAPTCICKCLCCPACVVCTIGDGVGVTVAMATWLGLPASWPTCVLVLFCSPVLLPLSLCLCASVSWTVAFPRSIPSVRFSRLQSLLDPRCMLLFIIGRRSFVCNFRAPLVITTTILTHDKITSEHELSPLSISYSSLPLPP